MAGNVQRAIDRISEALNAKISHYSIQQKLTGLYPDLAKQANKSLLISLTQKITDNPEALEILIDFRSTLYTSIKTIRGPDQIGLLRYIDEAGEVPEILKAYPDLVRFLLWHRDGLLEGLSRLQREYPEGMESMCKSGGTLSKYFDGSDLAEVEKQIQLLEDLTKSDNFAKYLFGKPEGVVAWDAVMYLDPKIKLNPTILGKVDVILTSGKIPSEKFKATLNSQLGEILNSADDINANKILDRLQESHVNEKHFDALVERLENPAYQNTLVKDLKDNPDWFETFEDIVHHPGKYWDILEDGTIPSSATLAKWGQGHWWKNLREKASKFEVYDPLNPSTTGAAQRKFADDLNIDVDNVGTQITIEVNGKRTRLDYMAKGNDGKFNLGEAKFSTKDKDWKTDWTETTTSKQAEAFPDIISKKFDIEIKVSDPDKVTFIEEVLGISKNTEGKYIISKEDIGLFKLLGSVGDNASVVKSVIDLID